MATGTAGVYADNADVEMLNNKIEDLYESITYLDAHHIDTRIIKDKYDDLLKTKKQYLASINRKGKSGNDTVLKQLLEFKIEALEHDLKIQTNSVNRLDLLFKIMLLFGTFIGIISAIYFAVMYNKRK